MWKDVIEQAEWRSGEPLQDGLIEFYLSCSAEPADKIPPWTLESVLSTGEHAAMLQQGQCDADLVE